MQKYKTIKKLGSGSFGNVQMAQNKETKQIVAIKQLKKKYGTWQQCLQLSQVKALRKMNHINVIKLKEVIRVVNQAFFVFQYVEKDLYRLITQKKQKGQILKDEQIRQIVKQLIQAIIHIHKQGFFHRDLKPENILISSENIIKVIDFGISRQIRSKPPYTEYISTRWYRAPEILFRFATYSSAIDIFALGCIVAEMYTMKPIFLGLSQIDQISKIASILGTPNNTNWPQGYKQCLLKGINIPDYKQIPLNNIIPNCPSDALNFISDCLKWDPFKRINLNQILIHPYIKNNLNQNYIAEKFIQKNQNIYTSLNIKSTNQLNRNKNTNKIEVKDLHKDNQFDQLLNNFANYQIPKKDNNNNNSSNINDNKDDDDEWF